MNKIRNISIFSVAMVLLALLVENIASFFFTDPLSITWVIPVYFWIIYAVALALFDNDGKSANTFLLFKGFKMLLTMMLMFALAFVFRSHIVQLITYFLVYFLILLVAESSFLLYIKKRR